MSPPPVDAGEPSLKRQALEVEARLVAAPTAALKAEQITSAADSEVSALLGGNDEPPSAGIPGIDGDGLFNSFHEGEIAAP